MKEVRPADIKNSKNATLKDYCDRLWDVAKNIDIKTREFVEKDEAVYRLLFDYSSKLQQII